MMKSIKKVELVILLLLIPGQDTFTQTYHFKHLNLEDGLSQTTVNCMLQDSEGFMWIGTQDGLNRYDGYDFTIYRSDPVDSNAISHSWIWDLFEDRDKNIWIATWQGLTKYTPATNRFVQYLPDPDNPNSIQGERPTSICQDKQGYLWIGTWGGGLNRYNPSSDNFTCFKNDSGNLQSIPNNYIRKVYYDRQGRLWVGTWGGLSCITFNENGTLTFCNFRHSVDKPATIGSNQITAITEDHSDYIWIGTLGGGLNRFSEQDSNFISYLHRKSDPGSISSNDISVLFEDHLNNFWIGTPSNGLNLFDREKGTFRKIYADPDNPGSLNENNIYSIYEDRAGLLWIGAGGINIYDPRAGNFQYFKHNSKDTQSLSSNKITSFYEDKSGNIWIGTEGGGVNQYNRTTGSFLIYKHKPADSNSLSSNNVSSITGDRKGLIWVGTRGGGLNLFYPANKRFIHFTEKPDLPGSEGLNYINALSFTPGDILWIATYNKGLIRYDTEKNLFYHYKSNGRNKNTLPGNYLLRLFTDSSGKLWIGTWGAGLCCFTPETNRFTSFLANEKDPFSISGNIIHCIYETKDINGRIIWAGTSSGLSFMNLNDSLQGRFRHIQMKDGLPSNVVYGILEDNRQNIWISSNMGLSKFQYETDNIKNFDVNDGLQSNEFTGGAYLKLRDGKLIFGGVKGFNIFDPDKIKESTYQPPVVVTSFRVFNKEMAFNKSLNDISEIILSYKQNFFSFEFSALDFSKPAKIQYAYQMTGVDKNWVQAGKRRFASYTDMSPGNYVFRVKGTNSDGIWSDKIKTIRIIIKPPYWRTWWFKTLGVLLILFIFYALHRYRVQKLLEIERLRIRIASDLHDEIGSALTRIAIHSEQIQTSRDKEKVISSSKKIGTISREIIATMSDIIWSIDARNDTIKDLADRMRDITYNTLPTEEIKVSFSSIGMDKNKRMPVSYRQNLFYIFKEVINNILKHSGASEVNIRLSNSQKLFTMEISDNGHGFDPKKIRKGNGLKNIRMRTARIGAKLKIDSDNGVTILLKMKSF